MSSSNGRLSFSSPKKEMALGMMSLNCAFSSVPMSSMVPLGNLCIQWISYSTILVVEASAEHCVLSLHSGMGSLLKGLQPSGEGGRVV